jgi:hypothetical protein
MSIAKNDLTAVKIRINLTGHHQNMISVYKWLV